MFLNNPFKAGFGLALILAATQSMHGQIVIDGVADRTTYTDNATFRVQTNTGFTYQVALNGQTLPAGVFHTVGVMDYYDLAVTRTQTSDGAKTSLLRRFIVLSSRRGSPERGLIEWVPLPPIPSTPAEMAGAHLELMTPADYPAGLEIPVVARVVDDADNTRRVNGWVNAEFFEASAFRILRGVGHGFMPAASPGTASYNFQLQSLQGTKEINIESSTAWTTVSGILPSTTVWPPNSRMHVTGNLTIPAGATLTIGAGTVVRLNAGVNLTNSGRTVINGTLTQPVVFTPTNRVAPEQRAGAWGGWIMRGGELTATAAIMTGSGAAGSLSFSPGSSHRSEQPLLFAHNSVVRMTNCALINNAGQVGNGYRSSIVWDHCLVQRAVTCGEYDGGTNIFRNSALIEFPSVDGIYNATIADADYDGFYTINTTNFFQNSLFGFCKDDAIDSGSGGPGSLVLSNCWVESALHEALAWSGEGRRTWTYDTVLINNGQGLECGWSTGADSPLVYAEHMFSTGNSIGARYGDNYEGTSGLGLKTGFLTVSNSLVLHNYRDVFGQPWDNTWNYRLARMDIHDNWLTALNTNHPNNQVWNPVTDAALVAGFMTTPPNAPVGIGLALWPNQQVPSLLTNGLPVRLSSFTTNPVSVTYIVETANGTLATGPLLFTPGETVKKIFIAPGTLQDAQIFRVSLSSPVGGEITGLAQAYLVGATTATPLIPFGASWKYLDNGSDQGTAWRLPDFTDSGWATGLAEFGYGDLDEATVVNGGPSGARFATTYFRKTLQIANPSQFGSFSMRLLRDDAGIVYFNGVEVYRSANMPAGVIAYNRYTGGTAPPDNTIDTTSIVNTPTLLAPGANLVAVEIHQQAADSSDISFNLELLGVAQPSIYSARFGSDLVLYWSDSTFRLESSENLPGNWSPVPGATSPVTIVPVGEKKFYRLKNP